MSRAHSIDRHIDCEEARLSEMLNSGEISVADYNAEMRELQREARDAYEADREDALERVRDEWGF